MTDRHSSALLVPIKLVLYLASLLYGAAIAGRRILYVLKIFRSKRVPMRIVSVGNLTLGGTGKTPCVIALAEMIRIELKTEPCVLIRGYGWDEQAMLKKSLPDAPIMVGEDRVKQADRAIKLYGSSVGILDDGFQYWELERNLNIVLIDSTCPFGNGRLFPRGILREPTGALRRADIAIFTKVNKKSADLGRIKSDIKRINPSLSFCESVHKPKGLYDSRARKDLAPSALSAKRVVLVSSIGDPSYFEETVKDLGAAVVERMIFNDHHEYRNADIDRVRKRCDELSFDYIVTTEKDAVKLSRRSFSFGRYPLLTLVVEMEITAGREILSDRLRSLRSS